MIAAAITPRASHGLKKNKMNPMMTPAMPNFM